MPRSLEASHRVVAAPAEPSRSYTCLLTRAMTASAARRGAPAHFLTLLISAPIEASLAPSS